MTFAEWYAANPARPGKIHVRTDALNTTEGGAPRSTPRGYAVLRSIGHLNGDLPLQTYLYGPEYQHPFLGVSDRNLSPPQGRGVTRPFVPLGYRGDFTAKLLPEVKLPPPWRRRGWGPAQG